MRYSCNPTTGVDQTAHTNRASRKAWSYVRTVLKAATVFATSIQTGQTLFQVWDWADHIGLLW